MNGIVLQIVMPMAGRGERFRRSGECAVVKPLLSIEGRYFFEKALSSLAPLTSSLRSPCQIHAVIQRQHQDRFRLGDIVNRRVPGVVITMLDGETKGPVDTVLQSSARLDPCQPLLVLDCDLYFESNDWTMRARETCFDQGADGLLLSFTSSDSRYSYAQVGEAGNVIATAEKQVISDRALIGCYLFAKAQTFIDAAERIMKNPAPSALNEYYLSMVFSDAIAHGKRIECVASDQFISFGTPEELEASEAKLKGQNP